MRINTAWRWQSVLPRPPPPNIDLASLESRQGEAVIGANRSRPLNRAGVAKQEDANALDAFGGPHHAGSNPVSRTNFRFCPNARIKSNL